MHPAPKTHNETNPMQKQHYTKTCSDGMCILLKHSLNE